jgi:calcineurin-like phosphoesterase
MPAAYRDPFEAVDQALATLPPGQVVVVDVHAEATSEKQAMGWYLDGRAALVVGTHTHVPTADARLLHKGTAYCTDAGMCGARDSVIGDDTSSVIRRFLTQLPTRLPAADGPAILGGVLVDIDETTGRATAVTRCDTFVE